MPEFTAAQQLAIDAREKNILVSAAAGSGKTAVLVERILQIISDKSKPVDISRLLVVTFTDAAALEMRERILKALNEKYEANQANKHLAKQIMLISKASICTIHSFCNSVLRTHYSPAGLDPSFRIGDTVQIDMIKEDVLDSIFDVLYEEKDRMFYKLLDMYGGRFFDKGLRELILKIHNFCESSLDPVGWLTDSIRMFDISSYKDLGESIWGQMLIGQIKDLVNGALASSYEAVKFCHMQYGPVKYLPAVESDISGLSSLLRACDSGKLSVIKNELDNFYFEKLAAIRDKDQTDPGLKEIVKNIREKKVKKLLASIKERYFFKPFDKMAEDILEISPVMQKLCDISILFREKYSEEKLAANILDFGDLEHYTYKVLSENEAVANAYKEIYYEIYTDEYQDSNILQESILSLISRETGRFMVGDVKQSIYKFRRANPDIFIDKYKTYEEFGENLRIDLSMNFRSRKNILDSVNFLFKQLMSEEVGRINYGDAEILRPGADFSANDCDDTTELILIETKDNGSEEIGGDLQELDSAEKEAAAVAKRILHLTARENPNRAKYGDITILLRSISHAQTFVSVLTDAGIPVFTNNSGGYFDNIEVQTILSLLRVIDNPRQDISLLSLLHSPIYDIRAGDLALIRAQFQRGDFYSAILNYMEQQSAKPSALIETLNRFTKDLKRWRRLKSQLPVSGLISLVYDESSYLDYISLRTGAKSAKANLTALFEQAVRFEKSGLQGLFSFIAYMEKLAARDEALKNSAAENNENAVNIMTIHRSKGLEFPICILSNLGRRLNRSDEFSDLILHQNKGLGPIHISEEPRVKSNTLPRAVLASHLQAENYAEELRILYVALTRAKHKLILTGCISSYEKVLSSWVQTINYEHVKLPSHIILGASSYIDFVGHCLVRHKVFDKEKFLHGVNKEIYNDESKWKVVVSGSAELQKEDCPREAADKSADIETSYDIEQITEVLADIESKFSWVYPNIKDTILPSKISISEIKRNFISRMKYDSKDAGSDFLKPSFDVPKFASRGSLTAAERGMAMHTLMEHININKILTLEDIVPFVDNLKHRNLLSEKEAASIDVYKINNFINSQLAERMRRADYLRKEIPFVLELEAEKAYLHNVDEGSLLVHGIIDCYFIENDSIILVDYKSDYVGEDGIEIIKNRYKIQLEIYRKALENALNMEVSECLLYLFDRDICVSI